MIIGVVRSTRFPMARAYPTPSMTVTVAHRVQPESGAMKGSRRFPERGIVKNKSEKGNTPAVVYRHHPSPGDENPKVLLRQGGHGYSSVGLLQENVFTSQRLCTMEVFCKQIRRETVSNALN